MDKFDNAYSYQPPRPDTYNRMAASAPVGNNPSYGETANSFEAALDRVRDQPAAPEVRPNPELEVESLNANSSDELELESDDDELDSGLLQQSSERPAAANTNTDAGVASARLKAADMKDMFEGGMPESTSVGMEGSLSGVMAAAPIVPSDATQAGAMSSANLQGALTAESVASLMLRLERTAGAQNGQWNFGVLGNQAGITALQLQRSAQGGWRVRVTFDESGQLDEKMHAEVLKASLVGNGHRVDSVTFAPASDELTFDD